MAIGLGTAILGSALIGGATAVGSGVIQGNAASNAADAQVNAANYATDVQRGIYDDQVGRIEPFRQLGLSAINPLADLMGLDYQYSAGGTAGTQPAPDTQPSPTTTSGTAGGNAFLGGFTVPPGSTDPRDVIVGGGGVVATPGATTTQPTATTGTAPATGTSDRPANALAALMERPGYQFRFDEGVRALDASAASRGLLGSGKNIKGATRYGQNYASTEYNNEFNRLLALMGGGRAATQDANQAAGVFGQSAGNNALAAGDARASGYINRGNATAGAVSGVSNNFLSGIGAYGGYRGWFDQ